MSDGAPKIIAIDHDDYHAEYVGRTADGRQFFLTYPFEQAARGVPGSEYVALFLFNEAGSLLEAKIEDFGPRRTMDHAARIALRDRRLRELESTWTSRVVE